MKFLLVFIAFLTFNFAFSQDSFTLEDTLVKPNQSLTAYRVKFDFDKYTIRQESFPYLDSIVAFLNANPSVVLEVRNHRDTRGSDKYSSSLTQRRARAVVEYFIEKGIHPVRLIAKGYGDIQPVISDSEISKMKTKEEQEKAHQKNRRMEFVIIKTDFKD